MQNSSVTKMKAYIAICVGILLISCMNSQTIVYVVRIRNFTIISDTIIVLNSTIYRRNMEHKVTTKVNVTKDMDIKSAYITINRCSYEKSDCEYAMNWTFPTVRSIKTFWNMKNQMWTKFIESIKPPMTSYPLIRKNIYESSELTVDANAIMAFYPEAINYYYQIEISLFYSDKKKAAMIWMEDSIHSFVKRDRARNRGNSTRKHSTKNISTDS